MNIEWTIMEISALILKPQKLELLYNHVPVYSTNCVLDIHHNISWYSTNCVLDIYHNISWYSTN